jgi:adenosylhomocysteine nucleosidase
VIVVSFALPEESKGLVKLVAAAERSGNAALPTIRGKLCGRDVAIVHAGMGMKSAAAQATAFLEKNPAPSCWIAAGFGGALSLDLKIGDIVTVQNFSDASLLHAIAGIPTPSHPGNLITTKQVIQTAEEKRDLARHTGAIAVDMESAAIHRLCTERGIPVLAIRAISDTASQDLPVPIEAWFNPRTQRPRPAKLVFYLATHPLRIAPFARFVAGVGRAGKSLTKFLLAAIQALPKEQSPNT